MRRGLAILLLSLPLAALSGCGAVRMEARPQLPPPLIEQLPATVAVHYPAEFREFLYREERYGVKYEFLLGPAHVVKLQRLLEAMFARVVEVEDPARAREAAPDVRLVLEPRFEDYAFLTPQDMAGDYFTVTIRYRLDLLNPAGERVDGYVFTGFGRQKTGTFSGNTEPLAAATQRAMRDAGAKLAVELASQASVRRLLDGEPLQPAPAEAGQAREALGSFGPSPPPPAAGGDGATGPASEESSGTEGAAGEEPPVTAPPPTPSPA